MLTKSKSLDKKLEKTEKPDWKQWVPYVGIYKIYRANFAEKKPAINDDIINHPCRYWIGFVWHATTITAGICATYYGLVHLLEKLN